MVVCKKALLLLMNRMDFPIEDIAYINGIELVAKKMNDSDRIIWWDMRAEGSGFSRLFKGSIKNACTQQIGEKSDSERIDQDFNRDRRENIQAFTSNSDK